jgi:tetratricopeptide (TPR) repeat protein
MSISFAPILTAPAGPHRSFGEALRFFRKRARLTQDELGRAVGYSREYIAQLERGHRKPDPSAVAALFVPALGLARSPDEARPLLELAAASRGKSLRDHGITIRIGVDGNNVDGNKQPARHGAHEVALTTPADDRLHQMLTWYVEMDPEAALRLANAMEPMWMAQDNYREARAWFGRILAHSTSETVTRAEALLHASQFAQRQGDATEALRLAESALAIYQAQGDKRGACSALEALGWAAFDLGHRDRARALFRDSLALARELNEPRRMLALLLAFMHEALPVSSKEHQWAEIKADLDECERLCHLLNDKQGLGHTLRQRGYFEVARGRLPEALRHQRESLRLFQAALTNLEVGWAELSVGETLWFLGELREAHEHFNCGLRIFRQSEHTLGIAIALHHLAQVDRREGKLDAATRRYTESLTLSREANNANMVARCAAGLGGVALASGDAERAAMLLAWAQAQFDALPPFLSRFDVEDYWWLAEQTLAASGHSAFKISWNAGCALSLDEAIALAME